MNNEEATIRATNPKRGLKAPSSPPRRKGDGTQDGTTDEKNPSKEVESAAKIRAGTVSQYVVTYSTG